MPPVNPPANKSVQNWKKAQMEDDSLYDPEVRQAMKSGKRKSDAYWTNKASPKGMDNSRVPQNGVGKGSVEIE